MTFCVIKNCGKPSHKRGWCRKHYDRWYRNGDPLVRTTRILINRGKECAVPKCGKPARVRGWCAKHYSRWRRNGDPITYSTRILINQGKACAIPKCGKRAVSRSWCAKHYQRYMRTGDPLKVLPNRGGNIREEGSVRSEGSGYRTVKLLGHPLADLYGWLPEHRKVMWDAWGEGPHPCWGCGKMLRWSKVVRNKSRKGKIFINHLNEDGLDNSLENLVFSCNDCNRHYSLMLMFMKRFGIELI